MFLSGVRCTSWNIHHHCQALSFHQGLTKGEGLFQTTLGPTILFHMQRMGLSLSQSSTKLVDGFRPYGLWSSSSLNTCEGHFSRNIVLIFYFTKSVHSLHDSGEVKATLVSPYVQWWKWTGPILGCTSCEERTLACPISSARAGDDQ